MPETAVPHSPAERQKTSTFASMADDSVAMAIQACELIGWRDIAGELQKAKQQTAARRRQIERG
jgi:hypothetical protein